MKKMIFYGIVLILLFNWVNATEVKSGEVDVLINAFESSEADLLEFNINTNLQLPDQFYTMEQMEEMREVIMRDLGIKGNVKMLDKEEHYDPYFMVDAPVEEDTIYINKNQDIGYNQITVSAVNPDGEMAVIILHSSDVENQKESHIIIDTVKNKGYKDIEEIIMKQQEILTYFGEIIEATTTLVGTKEGLIQQEDQKIWINSIIKSIKGKKIEEVMDDYYTSTTLYSKEIPMSIEYDGKQVNLQLATRYNAYENKTYLWIATPLITNTY